MSVTNIARTRDIITATTRTTKASTLAIRIARHCW